MKTYVTTCGKGLPYLSTFKMLADRFYGREIIVDLAYPDQTKADQLLALLETVDDYFILLEDDFWVVKPTHIYLLGVIQEFCISRQVASFSLQLKNAPSFSNWKETSGSILGHYTVYQTVSEVQTPFSLEASIWKKSFLLKWINWFVEHHSDTDQTDGQIENKVSDELRTHNIPTKIYALDKTLIEYRDAMRGGGERIITLREDPLRLTVAEGNELALYPQDDKQDTELCL